MAWNRAVTPETRERAGMTAAPETVVSNEKNRDCYHVFVPIKLPRCRGSLNNLHFGENVLATDSFYDGTLELRCYQDPGFSVGDAFPLWRD